MVTLVTGLTGGSSSQSLSTGTISRMEDVEDKFLSSTSGVLVRPSLGERELDGLDLFIQDGDQLLFSIIDMFFTVFGDGWS